MATLSTDKDHGLDLAKVLSAFPILLWARREALFMLAWCTTIAVLVTGRGFPNPSLSVLVVLSTFFVGASVYVYNDVVDVEMDRVSEYHKYRPIASGRVTKAYAWPTIIASGVTGLLISLAINPQTFLVTSAWLILFTIYTHPSIRLKKRFIVKEMVVSSAWPFCSLIGSLAVTGGISIQAIFSGLLFGIFIFLVQPALVDTLDIYQDSLFGIRSLGRILSWRRKVQMFVLGVLVLMTVTPLTYARMGFNVILPISVVAFSLVLLRWGIYPLTSGFELSSVMRTRKMMYVYFVGLQVILIVSSIIIL